MMAGALDRRPVRPVLEICVEGVASALAAEAGGADRVELCVGLAVDGLTPPREVVAEACRRLSIPVHVLVRPRAGGFVHDRDELATMMRSIDEARSLGAAGVVLGVNRSDATIDEIQLAALIARARPMTVTFHKAFDVLADPVAGLDVLSRLGVDRVLTSGGATTAREGLPRLAELAARPGVRTIVMAGGRVREDDLPRLVAAGLKEVHVGSAVVVGGLVDSGRVRRLVEVLAGQAPDLGGDFG